MGHKRTIAVLFTLGLAATAHAETFHFCCITGNNATDCATGEAQLSVDVTAFAANQVLFTFSNTGPAPSSITDVYFDDRPLLGIAGLIDADDGVGGDPGVDFSQLANPSDLPGRNMMSACNPDKFETTEAFSADSDPPTRPNGVDPQEFLGVVFELKNGTLANVIRNLRNGSLRIGIHVQGFSGGGSESFVTSRPDVPTLSEWGLAVLVLLLSVGISIKFGWRQPLSNTLGYKA